MRLHYWMLISLLLTLSCGDKIDKNITTSPGNSITKVRNNFKKGNIKGVDTQMELNITKFWDWFIKNEDLLYNFEKNKESIFQQLSTEMSKVHPDLSFEFGPIKDGKREFVVTAGGLITAFPAVELLCAKAPIFKKWVIIKFQPRREPMTLNIGGFQVKPEDIEIAIVQDSSKVGLTIFVQNYDKSKYTQFKQAIYMVLDQAIGEYDVETKVGFIDLVSFESKSSLKRYSIKDFPFEFDTLFNKIKDNEGVSRDASRP